MSQTTQQASGPFYIGIDFHKHYSVGHEKHFNHFLWNAIGAILAVLDCR